MRDNYNPEVDRLERQVQDLTNRIGAESESVRESRRAAAFSRMPDPATMPRPSITAPLPPQRPAPAWSDASGSMGERGRMGAAQMPGNPELTRQLEAVVKPDQVVAKLDGRVPVDMTVKNKPVKLEGQGVIVVRAAPGTEIVSAFGSGHITMSANRGNSTPPPTNTNRD